MKIKTALLLFISLRLASCTGQANENKQSVSDQTDYMQVVYAHCQNPDIIEVESITDGYIEVEYFCDGKRYEVGIKDNNLLFRECALPLSEIPLDKIARKLDTKYAGWTLDEVSQVNTNDTSFLKAEIVKNGIEQNVYFTEDGKWFKIKSMDIPITFDIGIIELNEMYLSAQYAFHKPDRVYEMPDLLKEVSGIALSSEELVYCIQDEIGSIFEYDMQKQEISNAYRFTDVGDFEDLAISKNSIYVLRSDGNLFVYDFKNKNPIAQSMLQINALNTEGICIHDSYIYIACKDPLVNQTESKRMIYKAKVNQLNSIEPYLEINMDDLSKFLAAHYSELGITSMSFNPSSIAVHPITQELYILSAEERCIVIYKEKQLINVIPLSAEIYYKPEGLSFYENGDLLISSEGDKKGFVSGTINLIQYK